MPNRRGFSRNTIIVSAVNNTAFAAAAGFTNLRVKNLPCRYLNTTIASPATPTVTVYGDEAGMLKPTIRASTSGDAGVGYETRCPVWLSQNCIIVCSIKIVPAAIRNCHSASQPIANIPKISGMNMTAQVFSMTLSLLTPRARCGGSSGLRLYLLSLSISIFNPPSPF